MGSFNKQLQKIISLNFPFFFSRETFFSISIKKDPGKEVGKFSTNRKICISTNIKVSSSVYLPKWFVSGRKENKIILVNKHVKIF